MTGTLSQAIGGVPANATLAITALSSGSRTISFSCAAANSSGSLTGVKLRFYKHRLPDITPGTTITNQVRHFAIQGRGFVSVMDVDSDWIGGLRRRDRFQGHGHELWGEIGSAAGSSTVHFNSSSANVTRLFSGGGPTGQPVRIANADGSNGAPRLGKTTDARGLSAFPYVFVKRVL
ncbi:hypothetical protein CH370_06380 [Leptospira kmetyi]|nr:hypothetical protein CH370_06380 [Leptospira kmetyi]